MAVVLHFSAAVAILAAEAVVTFSGSIRVICAAPSRSIKASKYFSTLPIIKRPSIAASMKFVWRVLQIRERHSIDL